MLIDQRGVATSATEPQALAALETALTAFQTYRGDPLAPLDEAAATDPGWAGARIAKALILMTFFERRFAREAGEALAAARPLLDAATTRDRALWHAADLLMRGEWDAGTAALDRVLVDHPRDVLALQAAHLMDFYRGDALNLRNRIARVMPHWSAAVPGYAYVLGMHAFGLKSATSTRKPRPPGAVRWISPPTTAGPSTR